MNQGRTVFSQLVEFLPTYQFQICVDRYQGNRYVKVSPAGISSSVWPLPNSPIAKVSAISKPVCVPSNPSSIIWASGGRSLATRWPTPTSTATGGSTPISRKSLIAAARDLYRDEPFGVELSETVYALDSTTIDLCLALFPWAKFRRRKSAVKLHTLLDLRGSIPTNVYVTGGQVHDVNILDQLLPEAGAFYLLDRGYVDFARLYVLAQACAFFVTRAKKNMQFYRRNSRPVERSAGLRCDQTILLTGLELPSAIPILCDASTISMPRRTPD